MFHNNAGFHFSGGRFYSVAGDVNLQINTVAGAGHPEEPRTIQDRDSLDEGFDGDIQRRFAPHSTTSERYSTATIQAAADTFVRPCLEDMVHIATSNVNHIYQATGLDTLHRHAVVEAMYDSAESFPQPRCHPETRIEFLEDLLRRFDDPDTRVLWLHGPAGAGKSAIMQSLCQRLHDVGRLGGSYFFKRGHPNRSNGRFLFATLAYQLAIFERSLKFPISKGVEANPTLVSSSIATQLRQLIVEPCGLASGCGRRILLIDGLDECDGIPVQQEILRSVGDIVCAHHTLPIKIIIASRPEPDISEMFGNPCFGDLDTINIEQSFADVDIFLRREFARIHKEHHSTMSTIPLPWPSDDVLSHLVEQSSGYFIYADTVIKFVDDKYFRPTEQLEIIFNADSECDLSPFSPLDQLYRQILCQVPNRCRPRLFTILSLIFHPGWPEYLTICHIAQLLDLEASDIQLAMRGLHSVFAIDADSQRIILRHASFRDFLISKERSSDFYIGSVSHRLDSARAMLTTLSCKHSPPADHIVWMVARIWIDYITSLEPCDVLLPLIREVNFDFCFLKGFLADDGQLVNWLAKTRDCPKDLLELWERVYHARSYSLEHLLNRNVPEGQTQLRRLQAFTHFLSIFSSDHSDPPPDPRPKWVSCSRILMDISWPEMLASIWDLQFFDSNVQRRWWTDEVQLLDSDPQLWTSNPRWTSDVYRDVAVAHVRLFRKISDGEILLVPLMQTRFGETFSTPLSGCPPSNPDLLHELHQLSLNWTEVSALRLRRMLTVSNARCIMEWLQTSPTCPPDLVRRWELSVSASDDPDSDKTFTILPSPHLLLVTAGVETNS
ncbi:hypothetical protein FB45DRAFT_340269 [Roridomyces roridus]|uniref:Nephrocystin 3-like N-terminal domain-containing protein n=1 Tax=Roridomyces roridus TaxID=1738132 RepID=A0AAD7FBZ3_9AGAR|nr:hypothetical protein FB45DRAFT_340269 [Roridomyces roridus]